MRLAGLGPVVSFLRRSGAPVDLLLARARLPPSVLYDPEGLIPLRQAFCFMEDSARVPGLENLGLLVGQQTPLEALGVFGRLLARSGTLQNAIETAVRTVPAFNSGGRFRLVRDGDRVRLCHMLADGLGAVSRQADQYHLMLAVNLVRLAAEPGWRPEEVRFQTREVRGLGDIALLAAATIAFGQRETAVTFAASLLARPLAPPSVPPAEGDDLEAWAASAPAHDFPGSVLQVIERLSSPEYPRIGLTADAIGMSVRALQRRLAGAGISYERLVMQSRFGTAVHLLEETDATVLDIALDLGYSDHAHFTRAFRRWTGVPPREFRRLSRRGTARVPPSGDAGLVDRSGAVPLRCRRCPARAS